MSRLIELDGTEPRILDESDLDPEKGDIAVCQCGLSAVYPFCDGSHRSTRDEADGVCYRYFDADNADADSDRQRRRVDHVRYDDETDNTVGKAVDDGAPDGVGVEATDGFDIVE